MTKKSKKNSDKLNLKYGPVCLCVLIVTEFVRGLARKVCTKCM